MLLRSKRKLPEYTSEPARAQARAQRGEELFLEAVHCEDDLVQKEALMRRAADLGDTGAIWRMGHWHMMGRIVRRDLRTAADWFARLGESGEHEMCRVGIECEWLRDDVLAVEVFTRAGRRGVEEIRHLADSYWAGEQSLRGGPIRSRDRTRALELYHTVAQLGCADVAHDLGRRYERGTPDVPMNKARALEMYQLAVRFGEGETLEDALEDIELLQRTWPDKSK